MSPKRNKLLAVSKGLSRVSSGTRPETIVKHRWQVAIAIDLVFK